MFLIVFDILTMLILSFCFELPNFFFICKILYRYYSINKLALL